MPKYRATSAFILWMLVLCPLTIALYFGLMPELEAMKNPEIPGEIAFKAPRTHPAAPSANACGSKPASGGSMDWLAERYEDLMTWEKNPWQTKRTIFGGHYFELLGSDNPMDQARAQELRRLGEALHRRVLERYPELAITAKDVPPERNGFLKWLEFFERFDADPTRSDEPGSYSSHLGFPKELKLHLNGDGPWDEAAAREWLASETQVLDEIRAIGLMPERSATGIDIDRWYFLHTRLAKNCAEALMLDARLAAGDGDVAGALESVRAANGLADHFGRIETPSLLATTAQILIQQQLQAYALAEIIPALPAGRADPRSWEITLNPQVAPPAEFARVMTGEWHVTTRQYLMPMLADTDDPKYPRDPEALIDFHAHYPVQIIAAYSGTSPADWNAVTPPPLPDNSHLSRHSRDLTEMLYIGEQAWSRGFIRAQSRHAMTRAALAIMNGEPIPTDPIHGQPYQWNPATRELAAPDSPVFSEMNLRPITVPIP